MNEVQDKVNFLLDLRIHTIVSQSACTCSKLAIETLEQGVNKDTRTTAVAFTPSSSVSIVNFEHVNADWDIGNPQIGNYMNKPIFSTSGSPLSIQKRVTFALPLFYRRGKRLAML